MRIKSRARGMFERFIVKKTEDAPQIGTSQCKLYQRTTRRWMGAPSFCLSFARREVR